MGLGKEKVKLRTSIIIASFIKREREREGKTFHKYGRIQKENKTKKIFLKPNSLGEGSRPIEIYRNTCAPLPTGRSHPLCFSTAASIRLSPSLSLFPGLLPALKE